MPNAVDLHGLQSVWSAAQASRDPKTAKFQKENPKTAAAIAAVPAATTSFLANELKDEALVIF